MAGFDRFSGSIEWNNSESVERERTPKEAIEVGIQIHLSILSISNTKQLLGNLALLKSSESYRLAR